MNQTKMKPKYDQDGTRKFPLQATDYRGLITVPWEHAEEAYKEYAALFGGTQSLERIAERGGFSVEEIVALLFQRINRIQLERLYPQ